MAQVLEGEKTNGKTNLQKMTKIVVTQAKYVSRKRQLPQLKSVEQIIDTFRNTTCEQTTGALARGSSRCALGLLYEKFGGYTQQELEAEDLVFHTACRINDILTPYEMNVNTLVNWNDRLGFTFKEIAATMRDRIDVLNLTADTDTNKKWLIPVS